jgi:diaminopimelate epimerase
MPVKFTKMHGLGNDFVLIDAVKQNIKVTPKLAKRLANRNLGIGCDQVLVLEPPSTKNVDFDYRIFNADGTEVEQCGNGARCLGRYIFDQRLSGKRSLLLKTKNRVMEIQSKPQKLISVNMSAPVFEPTDIPFQAERPETVYSLEADEIYLVSVLSMGNPHAVIQVADIDTAPVQEVGQRLQKHQRFPESVNVGFMQIIDRQRIKLRVFERGVGETQACGSGACAAAVAAIQQKLVDHRISVELQGGELTIEWGGDSQPVLMTGPAVTVFHGQIKL